MNGSSWMGQTLRCDRPVLIVEDDDNIAQLIELYLRDAGFQTVCEGNGERALSLFAHSNPLMVILDVMLPGMDGQEICRAIRRKSDVPVIMVTAKVDEIDRIVGLSLGADDYVSKPFSPRELVERVRAVLRRTNGMRMTPEKKLEVRGIVVDRGARSVMADGCAVDLTRIEFDLLVTFMEQPERAFSRSELIDIVKGDSAEVIDRVIDVHVSKLRKKIGAVLGGESPVRTVHGIGYKFDMARRLVASS